MCGMQRPSLPFVVCQRSSGAEGHCVRPGSVPCFLRHCRVWSGMAWCIVSWGSKGCQLTVCLSPPHCTASRRFTDASLPAAVLATCWWSRYLWQHEHTQSAQEHASGRGVGAEHARRTRLCHRHPLRTCIDTLGPKAKPLRVLTPWDPKPNLYRLRLPWSFRHGSVDNRMQQFH